VRAKYSFWDDALSNCQEGIKSAANATYARKIPQKAAHFVKMTAHFVIFC
jgi:hypothetical protein